jgi:hypothetical protein
MLQWDRGRILWAVVALVALLCVAHAIAIRTVFRYTYREESDGVTVTRVDRVTGRVCQAAPQNLCVYGDHSDHLEGAIQPVPPI